MSFLKNLLSRHLLGRETPSSLQPGEAAANREEEHALALLLAGHPESRMLPANHPDSIRVRRMAAGLIAAACDDDNYGHRRLSPRTIRRPFRGVDWSFGVVDADECANGFSNSSGRIWVTTGLLWYRDATVAAVLAHEIGHVIARHAEKRMRNWALAGFLANFAGELLDAPPGDKGARKTLRALFLRPSYYNHEYEADRIGMFLLAAAGYDPRAMCRLLWRGGTGDSSLPDNLLLLSRHPARKKRLERLSQAKVMDQALDLYRQAAARSARQARL